MKTFGKVLKWGAGILLCAWLGQYLLAMVVPTLIMGKLHKGAGEMRGYNVLSVSPRPDEDSRWVVRPSPDLLYALCAYNLNEGPVTIEAPVPERYWSMQFYQMNTDNFAGFSNRRDELKRIGTVVDVTLIGPEHDPKDYAGEVIQSPTQKGVMLLRASGIGDASETQAALAASSCGPV